MAVLQLIRYRARAAWLAGGSADAPRLLAEAVGSVDNRAELIEAAGRFFAFWGSQGIVVPCTKFTTDEREALAVSPSR